MLFWWLASILGSALRRNVNRVTVGCTKNKSSKVCRESSELGSKREVGGKCLVPFFFCSIQGQKGHYVMLRFRILIFLKEYLKLNRGNLFSLPILQIYPLEGIFIPKICKLKFSCQLYIGRTFFSFRKLFFWIFCQKSVRIWVLEICTKMVGKVLKCTKN